MRLVFNILFGIIVSLLYALGAITVFVGFWKTAGYDATGFGVTLFELTAGGITAFLVTTLGLSVANEADKTSTSVRLATSGDQNKGGGGILIVAVSIIFLTVGLAFVVLSCFPGMLAGYADGKPYTDAPEYLATQAKVFVGVALGGLTAAGAALKATS